MKGQVVRCAQFELLNIIDIDSSKCIGEHAEFWVKGIIGDSTKKQLETQREKDTYQFYAYDSKGTEKIIFSGIVQDLSIVTENSVHTLSMRCVSKSILTDVDTHIRTFQDAKMTYGKVTEIMASASGNLSILVPEHARQPIKHMLMQYQETDWEFAKRIAGEIGTVVVPDYLLDTPYFSVGIPKHNRMQALDMTFCETKREIGKYIVVRATGNSISPRDEISYTVKSRDILQLCDAVPVNGDVLYVYSIHSHYEGQELVHNYDLKSKGAFCSKKYYNQKIIGASLEGTILNVEADHVMVEIDGDVRQTQHKWFPYATPFSVPSGAGWYFMPEIGDAIRLRFPSEMEREAYVASSIHITHGRRRDPKIKYIRTIYDQEIRFAPTVMTIDDGDGTVITLRHGEGITLNTKYDIRLQAQETLDISALQHLKIEADERVAIYNNDSIVNLDENIDIISAHTRII